MNHLLHAPAVPTDSLDLLSITQGCLVLYSLLPLFFFAGRWSASGHNTDHLSGVDHLLHDPALPTDPLHMGGARDHAAVHVPSGVCAVLCY